MQRLRSRFLVENLRPLTTWSSGTGLPTFTSHRCLDREVRTLTTDASTDETKVDARVLLSAGDQITRDAVH